MINRATALASSTPRRARKTTSDILATLPRPPFPRHRERGELSRFVRPCSRSRCDLLSLGEPRTVSRLARNACKVGASRECTDLLLTCDSAQTTRNADLQVFSSPLTDSNRRPPPYHGGSGAVRAITAGDRRARFSCKSPDPPV